MDCGWSPQTPRLQSISLLISQCDISRPLTSLRYNEIVSSIERTAGGRVLAINFEKAGHLTVRVASSSQAALLLSMTSIGQVPVAVRYPGSDTSFKGQIHGVSLYTPTDIILNELRAFGVVQVTRAIRHIRQNGEIISTPRTTLTLTFSSQDLPYQVTLGHEVHVVHPLIPPSPQCFRCQHYGHLLSNCRGKLACRKCAGKHMTKACTSSVIKCALCSGAHTATFHQCPVRRHHFAVHRKALAIQTIQTTHSSTNIATIQTSHNPHPAPNETAGFSESSTTSYEPTSALLKSASTTILSYANALRVARKEVNTSRIVRLRSVSRSRERRSTSRPRASTLEIIPDTPLCSGTQKTPSNLPSPTPTSPAPDVTPNRRPVHRRRRKQVRILNNPISTQKTRLPTADSSAQLSRAGTLPSTQAEL